jgi:hypothetical protein
MANQEMYKHDALLHLLWIVATANTTTDDEKYGAVSSVEDEYYEKVKKAEGINISFSEIRDKRNFLRESIGTNGILNEALKATNGCGREWRTKVYGYMWRMALKSWESEYYNDGDQRLVSKDETTIINKARKYFGITEEEDEKCISLTKV